MSKYTEVNVMVTGQAIQLASAPLIASGGINSVKVNFTFDSIWDGMAKTAVFYTDPKQAVQVLLADDSAVVPSEILGKDGTFFLGAFGTNEEQVFPSVFVGITINKGAASLQPVDPAEPTPDIYQQLTSAYAKMNNALALEKARIDEIVALQGSDGAVEYSIESGGFVGTIKSNGIFAHIMLDGVPTLAAGETTIFSQLIPSRFAPLSVVELRCDYPGVTVRIGTLAEGAEYVNLIFINSTNAVIEDYISISGEYALETVSIPELRDLRVASDGTVYPTAGEAVRARRIPCIVDSGDPNDLADYTDEGEAAIGLLYLDEDNGNLYKCTAFTDGAYVWEPVVELSGYYTKEEVDSISAAIPQFLQDMLSDYYTAGQVDDRFGTVKTVNGNLPNEYGNLTVSRAWHVTKDGTITFGGTYQDIVDVVAYNPDILAVMTLDDKDDGCKSRLYFSHWKYEDEILVFSNNTYTITIGSDNSVIVVRI